MMDDNRCFLAANPIKSLENALLAVKYGARNALHSQNKMEATIMAYIGTTTIRIHSFIPS